MAIMLFKLFVLAWVASCVGFSSGLSLCWLFDKIEVHFNKES